MSVALEFNFACRSAVILHPAESVRTQLAARLAALGVTAAAHWPGRLCERLPFSLSTSTWCTMCRSPWEPGSAPIPMIGLIRSECPGRLSWALQQIVDAFLSLAAPGLVYSTLVVATAKCAERQRQVAREVETVRRTGLRHVLIQAVVLLMQRDGINELAAPKRLRAFAMTERLPLEDAAAALLDRPDDHLARRQS